MKVIKVASEADLKTVSVLSNHVKYGIRNIQDHIRALEVYIKAIKKK